MRKFFAIVLLVLGVPILLAGSAAAVFVGSDDTFDLATATIDDDDTAAVVTGVSFLEVEGPTLHVTADGGDAETFVGVAHPVHVAAYFDDVPYMEITDVTTQRELTMLSRDGESAPADGPVGLDWWADTTSGRGAQTVGLPLNNAPVQVVAMQADGSTPLNLDLRIAAEVEGLFVTTLIVAGTGFVFVVGGILLLRSARRRKRANAARSGEPAPSDETSPDETTTEESAVSTTQSGPKVGFDQLRRGITPLALGAGAVVLAGCAEVPESVERDDGRTVPAATTAQIEDFFAKYTKTNNAANAEFDTEMIGSVEGGTLLAASEFGYAEAQAQDLDPVEPFTIAASSTARPALSGYPMWYLAADDWDGESEGSTHYLVTREGPTAPWLATLSVSVPGEVEPPQPLLRDGRAQLADDAVTSGAEEVFDKLASYAEGGDEPDDINVSSADGLGGIRGLGVHIADFSDEMGTTTLECGVDDSDSFNWLATESGGAVAMGSLSCTQSVELNDGYWFQMGEPYGTIPAETDLNGTTASASVSFIIGIEADGTATVVDDGAELTATDHTEYTGDKGDDDS